MNNIEELSSFSPDQHKEISEHLFAVARYRNLISTPPTTDLEKLRCQRHEAWLRSVYSIYFNRRSARDICAFWSAEAMKLIQKAWQWAEMEDSSLALFALGKLGAMELNLSSDVDLMIISNGKPFEQRRIHTFQKILQESTSHGFVFRVDFDLRPGGRLGPLVSSLEQFEDYYGNYGSTWERMAFVRLMPICGNPDLRVELPQLAEKISFRKFIDYTLFEDFKDLRPQIHASDRNSESHFNLKLHSGGIRDIELFTHAMQVIHGGKVPELRIAQTDTALETLGRLGLLPTKDWQFLVDSYWRLRDLENRVQAEDDQQTHTLSFEARKWIFNNTSLEELQKMSIEVDRLVSSLLGPSLSPESLMPNTEEDQESWLKEKGFEENLVEKVWPQLIEKKVRSRSEQRDERARLSFLASFIQEISSISLDQNLALRLLVDFIDSIRAKASFFTLLNREPALIRELAFLLSASPYLGQILSNRPELMDSFFLRRQEPPSHEFEEFIEFLTDKRLLSELIAANDFLPQRNIPLLLAVLSQNADEICNGLLERIKEELGVEEHPLRILAMGKWAGFELGFRSDLDFVMVSRGKADAETHKLARKFINTLSARTRGGSIYPIDLRLRPSGKSGPIIVSEDELKSFLNSGAKAWERQAYIKSRFLAGSDWNPAELTIEKGLSEQELRELKNIRNQLRAENSPKDKKQIHLKYHPGGLVDIEFAVQIACLSLKVIPEDASTQSGLTILSQNETNWKANYEKLNAHYLLLREFEQLNQLCMSGPGSILDLREGRLERMARLLGRSSEEIESSLKEKMAEVYEVLEELDPALRAR